MEREKVERDCKGKKSLFCSMTDSDGNPLSATLTATHLTHAEWRINVFFWFPAA